MTNADLIEVETRVRHKFHKLERMLAVLKDELEAFADDMAGHHGIPANDRSGGDADDKQPG